MKTLLAVALAFQIMAGFNCAHGQAPARGTPAANFFDDDLLGLTAKELSTASRHEIDLMTDLLATCSVYGLDDNDEQFGKCSLAYERYKIAYDEEQWIKYCSQITLHSDACDCPREVVATTANCAKCNERTSREL